MDGHRMLPRSLLEAENEGRRGLRHGELKGGLAVGCDVVSGFRQEKYLSGRKYTV